jgi:hypothetical protein
MKWWPPLSPFMGGNLNHAHYPDGDGTDFLDVDLSGADGCLQFTIDGGLTIQMNPASLTLKFLPESPRDSFLPLELAPPPNHLAWRDRPRQPR